MGRHSLEFQVLVTLPGRNPDAIGDFRWLRRARRTHDVQLPRLVINRCLAGTALDSRLQTRVAPFEAVVVTTFGWTLPMNRDSGENRKRLF